MDELQLATNQYFQMMNANIVAYDISLSKSLTTREYHIYFCSNFSIFIYNVSLSPSLSN